MDLLFGLLTAVSPLCCSVKAPFMLQKMSLGGGGRKTVENILLTHSFHHYPPPHRDYICTSHTLTWEPHTPTPTHTDTNAPESYLLCSLTFPSSSHLFVE